MRAFLLLWSAAATCLPDSIPEALWKNLSADGKSFPLGQWVSLYPAGHATGAVAEILMKEKLGYLVAQSGGPATPDAFFGVAGCEQPTNVSDRACSGKRTDNHFSLEVWTTYYLSIWEELEKDWPEAVPLRLGSMGYNGATSYYITSSLQQKAYEAEGLSLDFYREYNTSWRNPRPYFTSPRGIDTEKLLPCNQTTMVRASSQMAYYANLTGDTEGVQILGDQAVARCFDHYFWYPPVCRADPSSCAIMLTGGTGWGAEEFMQKATVHQMPAALAVAGSWNDYSTLPLDYQLLFYWWVPDPTFLSISPKKIIFPPYDGTAWRSWDQTSQAMEIPVEKLVSQDLPVLAPDVVELLNALVMDMHDVEKMLRDQLETGDSWSDVACRWLHLHTATWTAWLPDKTKCLPQFGLYHEKEERFVDSRINPAFLSCRACPSGYFSMPWKDSAGRTFICQRCSTGSFQASGAALSCDPCPLGEYQDELGSVACRRCARGEYQHQQGQSSCLKCPSGTTTLGFGSMSRADCGCDAKTIDTGAGEVTCVPCGEGLHCPFSATVENLQRGESTLGSEYVPRVVEGYFAPVGVPLQIFKCKPLSYCPGGVPGACRGGLQGEPCAECPAGQTWSGGQCHDCGETAVVGIFVVCFFLLGLGSSYYFMNWQVTPQSPPTQAALTTAGISVNVLQFMAISGMMTVRWPGEIDDTVSSLQFILLDLDNFGLSCIATSPFARLVLAASVFPSAFLWLIFIHLCSRVVPRCKAWQLPKTLNTIGGGEFTSERRCRKIHL